MRSRPLYLGFIKFNCLLIALSLAVVILFINQFAHFVYPIPDNDSIDFMPPTLSFALDRQLNSVSTSLFPQKFVDFAGTVEANGRYIWYTPLFPLVIGALMPTPSPQTAFAVIGLINTLNIALTAVTIFLLWEKHGNILSSILFSVILLSIGYILTGEQGGRPEVLSSFWVNLGILAIITVPTKYMWIVLGVLLGLLGGTHLASFGISLALAGGYFSIKYDQKSLFWVLIKFFVVVIVILILSISASPNGFWDTLRGTIFHARFVASRYDLQFNDLIYYWIFNPRALFFGVVVFTAGGCTLFLIRSDFNRVKSKAIFILFMGATVFLVYLAGFKNVLTYYNILPFASLAFIIIFQAWRQLKTTHFRHSSFAYSFLFLVVLLPSIGWVRNITLFEVYMQEGISLDEARQLYRALPITERDEIAVSSSLWDLGENYDQMEHYEPGEPSQISPSYIVLQQNYSGLAEPPEIKGYSLRENYFVTPPNDIRRFLYNTVPGYSFAVFQRDS